LKDKDRGVHAFSPTMIGLMQEQSNGHNFAVGSVLYWLESLLNSGFIRTIGRCAVIRPCSWWSILEAVDVEARGGGLLTWLLPVRLPGVVGGGGRRSKASDCYVISSVPVVHISCSQTTLNALFLTGYAIPAVNCVSSSGINACLEAARKNDAPIIIQFSSGGSQVRLCLFQSMSGYFSMQFLTGP
jgi:hypothetical protein